MRPYTFPILLILIFFNTQNSIAQLDGRFGVTIGATNYVTDTNFISSKSSTGFTVGMTGTAIFSDKFELLLGINYYNHRVKFIGRETPTSPTEEINFNLQNIGIPAVINYTFFELKDFRFGVNLGPVATFYYGYSTSDSKSEYLLDPLQGEARIMNFDNNADSISFNAFVSMGLSAQYNRFMCNLNYNKGITDPYRKAPIYSPVIDIEGKDSYVSFTITYFFND